MTKARQAPCQEACPAGVDVPAYVRNVRAGRYGEALAVVRDRIPFPLVCGYACFHPCEASCARKQLDEPVAIRMLKRVAAEQGLREQIGPVPRPASGKRAAIVGSGPCGLTAAYELALLGHAVTVFEALERSGGMLRFGIPAYRLPDAVVDADIRVIEQAGVTIRTGTRVASAEALLGDGFDAVLIATGAWRSARMSVPGADAPHVLDGLAFLAQVNAGTAPKLGARVVVIGGGNTAIDAARVSRRLGAEVMQVYRRTRAEMPASAEEIADAVEEGVALEFLSAPVRIDRDGVTCIRMSLGEPDASGRPRPVPTPGSEYTIAAGTVIMAIGQEVEIPGASLARQPNGTVAVDGRTLATSTPGVFAAGDSVLGPATIIDAIAQGRAVAGAMDRFLGGSGAIASRAPQTGSMQAPPESPRGRARHAIRTIPLGLRLGGFAVVEQAYDKSTATQEAMRCLSCDLREFDVAVDAAVCKDCGYCREVCAYDVFGRSDEFNASGYQSAVAQQAQRCTGCLNCLYICPDFAITITQRPAAGVSLR